VKFKVGMNGNLGEYEVHSATCPDPARKARKGELTGPAWIVKAETAQAALDISLDECFGTAQDKDGVTHDDASYRVAGFGGRIFPCTGVDKHVAPWGSAPAKGQVEADGVTRHHGASGRYIRKPK